MKPSSEFISISLQKYNTVPVFSEFLADAYTPVRIYKALSGALENSFMLESVDNNEKWGRYSFIGISPELRITIKGHKASVTNGSVTREIQTDDPIEFISGYINRYKAPEQTDAPAFTGGLVGYFGYDTVRFTEHKLTNIPADDIDMPDCDLFLYNEIIAFDHLTSKIIIIQNVRSDCELSPQKQLTHFEARANEIMQMISSYKDEPVQLSHVQNNKYEITSNVTNEEFIQNVQKAKEYIRNGDIFQIVLSQRFQIKNPPDSFSVYRHLRSSNPSPYLYYFRNNDYSIAGASPEMLVNIKNSVITTKPIAGTAQRGSTESEDLENEKKLLSDAKEKAEHTMLVDLGRNDIGKVSEYGSVEVKKLMYTQRSSRVMHLVSDVQGKLRKNMTPADALMAVLPAGTLSGAPKVRAMQLIDQFEKTKRGLYGGTVGYIGFDQNMDTCIAIRTVLFKNDTAYIQAGAGIVADSDAQKEYNETKNKAYAMINAVKQADSSVLERI